MEAGQIISYLEEKTSENFLQIFAIFVSSKNTFLYELHYQQSEVFELGEYFAWGHSSQGTISKKKKQQQQQLAFDLNFQSQCNYSQPFNAWYTLKGNIGNFQVLLCMLYV